MRVLGGPFRFADLPGISKNVGSCQDLYLFFFLPLFSNFGLLFSYFEHTAAFTPREWSCWALLIRALATTARS